MATQINNIKKSDNVLVIEPFCDTYFHSSINTIILLIINKLSNKIEFFGSYSHNKIIKEIWEKLKIKNSPKFSRLGLFKKNILIWEVQYLINILYTLFLIKKSHNTKVIFTSIDYTVFPIFLILFRSIIKDSNTYFLVIHKGLNVLNKNRLISRVWKIIFQDPKINFIFLDKSSNRSINKFKNIICNHERINILKCKDVEFNINTKEENTVNKIFCSYRDYQEIINNYSNKYDFSLIENNNKFFIKTKKGEKLNFLIFNNKKTISSLSYLKKLNQCKYILVNKSRENGMFSSGLRIDGLWSKKIILEF